MSTPRYLNPANSIYGFLIIGSVLRFGGNAQNSGFVGDKCRTPDDLEGECTEIRPCKPLMQILQRRSLGADDIKFLRESRCGSQNGSPLVCCPSAEGEYLKGIDSHPNWKLINSEHCGVHIPVRPIVTTAELGEYTMLALLQYQIRNDKEFMCTGFLISDQYVLTAAHCIQGTREARLISVRLGEYNLKTDPDCEIIDEITSRYCSEPVQDINVEEVIAHPNYGRQNRSVRNDIALVRLERPATLNKGSLMPICLPNATSLSGRYAKGNLIAAGWSRPEQGSTNDVMWYSNLRPLNNEECMQSSMFAKVTLEESQMCAVRRQSPKECVEEYGWPIMTLDLYLQKWVAVGIESFGAVGCTNNNQPSVYTQVAPYMEWILDNMRP